MWNRIKQINDTSYYYNEEIGFSVYKASDNSCWIVKDNKGRIRGACSKLRSAKTEALEFYLRERRISEYEYYKFR